MRAHEFVSEGREKFVAALLEPGVDFTQEIVSNTIEIRDNQEVTVPVTITYKATSEVGQLMITALDPEGKRIGQAVFWKHPTRSGLESQTTEVAPGWNRLGIATNMYAVVRMLGGNINPSLFQTKQGNDMWKKWRKQGDVAQLKNMNAKIKDQDVAETINTDILNKRFRHKQVIGDYTYKASVEMFFGEPLLSIKAYDGDREIGHILFEIIVRSPGGKRKPSADYLESGGTEVDPAYRNKGVASTMYAYAKMLGNDVQPSNMQTSQGHTMWAAWKHSGDAKHLVGTSMEESTVSENFADGKVSGKSRPGRVKKSGASCSGSVTDLRARAKNASGEKARMYHWCANMKSGRQKTNEVTIGVINMGAFTVVLDDHLGDRVQERNINPNDVDHVLRKIKLPRVIKKIMSIDLGSRFYVLDHSKNLALGFRRIGDNKLVLKTAYPGRPMDLNIAKIITV